MIRFVASILLVTLFIGCGKDKDDCDLPSFSGVSWTDFNGQPMSNPDPDDWTFDDEWSNDEASFFDTNYDLDCTPAFDYWITAYPNPLIELSQVLFLAIGKDSTTSTDIRIVDDECNVLFSIDDFYSQNILFDLEEHQGKTLRMYYRIVQDDCEFRGHGDIQVN